MHSEIEKIKREFRSLWISRINAGSRMMELHIQNLFMV